MGKVLEGYVDDGKAAPLPNVSTVVTVVGAGTVVTSGVTDANGHWYFDGLDEGPEYFVNVIDVDGNAVVRGPWSGEVRDVWVRDRLAVPDTATVRLPNSGATRVGDLPLALAPDAGNALEWRAGGLYTESVLGLSEAEADLRYEPLDSAYTKVEADALFLTEVEADLLYSPIDAVVDAYTKAESDALYPLKADVDPYPQYLTLTEAEILFEPIDTAWTKAEADATYVNLDGDTMTGNLTIAAGSLTLEAGRLYILEPNAGLEFGAQGVSNTPFFDFHSGAVNVDFDVRLLASGGTGSEGQGDLSILAAAVGISGVLAAEGKLVAASSDGGNALEWRGDGFYVPSGAGVGIDLATADARYVNIDGDTMSGDLIFGGGTRLFFPDEVYDDKITLYTGYTIGIRGGTMAYFALTDDDRHGFFTNGVERAAIRGSGVVAVNPLTDPALPAAYTAQPGLLVQHQGAHLNGLSLARASSADASGETLNIWRSRGTWASKAAVANGDALSQISVHAWSGANWLNTSTIQTVVTGTVTTTVVPTDMRFFVTDTAGALTERLRIQPGGQIGVGGMANGSASGQLDVQPISAAQTSVAARAHTGAVNTTCWFKAIAANQTTVVLGANNLGWVTEVISATAIGTFATKRIPVYNVAGTLQGYLALYS